MFQLLKKFLVLPLFYLYCVPVVCDDVLHVNGNKGQNLTVTFTLKNKIETNRQVFMYRDDTKIHSFIMSNRSCFSPVNNTLSTICIDHVSQRNISLIFTHLIHSGVYHLVVLTQKHNLDESNKVNLTVYTAEYTTTYTTAASSNNTSFHLDRSEKKPLLMLVLVLVVVMMLVIILPSWLYWSCRRKTDKTPAVNSTSAPQVIPDVSCVEYCVLDFPNRAGEKVRSTEERVEYSPIVFPSRKTSAQDKDINSTTQQNKIKMPTLQCEERETDKVSEKSKTSKPKHHKCKKNHT